jgi:hypothetical protein
MEKHRRLIRRKKFEPAPPERTATVTAESATAYESPPRNHPLYALVGEISMRWSFIESLLDACIGTLADISPEITACITAQMMGHVPRCLTIKALANWRGLPDIEDAATKLQNKLFEVSELRNRAIHDRLLIETREQRPFREHRMSKKELHYGLLPVDPQDLEKTLTKIDDRRKDCAKLFSLIREQVYDYHS